MEPCPALGSGLQFSSLGRTVQGLTAPPIQWSAQEKPGKRWSTLGLHVTIHVFWNFRATTEKGREGRTRVSGLSFLFISLMREAAWDSGKSPEYGAPGSVPGRRHLPSLESPVLYLSSGDSNLPQGLVTGPKSTTSSGNPKATRLNRVLVLESLSKRDKS